jgi:hypothetical protein
VPGQKRAKVLHMRSVEGAGTTTLSVLTAALCQVLAVSATHRA